MMEVIFREALLCRLCCYFIIVLERVIFGRVAMEGFWSSEFAGES